MSATYTYTYSDFPNGINSDKLTHEIRTQFPTLFDYVAVTSDIKITFTSSLTVGEQATLDGIVASFTPDWDIPGDYVMHFSIYEPVCTSTTFMEVGCTTFQLGNLYPTNIKIVSTIVASPPISPPSFYQLQVRDINTDLVLASGQFTNTTTQVIDLGVIDNVPMDETILVLEALVEDSAYPLKVLDAKLYYNI